MATGMPKPGDGSYHRFMTPAAILVPIATETEHLFFSAPLLVAS